MFPGRGTVESFATVGGGTFSKTLNVFWLTTWAAAGTRCANAQPTAALTAKNALVDGILTQKWGKFNYETSVIGLKHSRQSGMHN